MAACAAGCDPGVEGDGDGDLDADGDADLDVDGDADLDVDGDAGGDADGDDLEDADADEGDGGEPLDGFGVVGGACGVLDDEEWTSTAPFLFRSSVDFGAEAFDPALLSAGAREILAEGTAGGSSGTSEAMAFDLLHRCEGAELLLSETEVEYLPGGSSITDFLASIDGRNVAVSVTRAYRYPPSEPCTVEALQTLLERKLEGAIDAEYHASPANPWERSILSVIAWSPQCADAVEAAYAGIDTTVRSDTIVMIAVTEGDDEFIY